MSIETQTDTLLVLRQPRPVYARFDLWAYVAAIFLAIIFGIFSVRTWFENRVSHETVIYATVIELAVCAILAGYGVWLDWIHAEVVCRLDKSERVLTVERTTPRYRRTIQYALDELQRVDLKIFDSPDKSTAYAIRFRFGGERALLLRRSRRQHEQDIALAAIRQFLKRQNDSPADTSDSATASQAGA